MALLFARLGAYVYAQESGKITGRVRDTRTHDLISFATVTLTDQKTKVNVKSTQTDINGNFILDNLSSGIFSLRLSFVGYDPVIKDSIVFRNDNNVLNFDDFQMSMSKNKVLNEVVITAKKLALQNQDGKKVFSLTRAW